MTHVDSAQCFVREIKSLVLLSSESLTSAVCRHAKSVLSMLAEAQAQLLSEIMPEHAIQVST